MEVTRTNNNHLSFCDAISCRSMRQSWPAMYSKESSRDMRIIGHNWGYRVLPNQWILTQQIRRLDVLLIPHHTNNSISILKSWELWYLLFIPASIVNEILDLFVLNLYFQTLGFVDEWPVETQHLLTCKSETYINTCMYHMCMFWWHLQIRQKEQTGRTVKKLLDTDAKLFPKSPKNFKICPILVVTNQYNI